MLKTRRNYAQLVAVAVTTLAPLVASAATSLLGASIRRFNALPRAERKRALRESLASRKATAILGPNAIVARQVAKSDTALDALLDTMEEHGVGATKAGGEIAHAAAREATSAALARTAKKNGIMSAVGRQMLTVKAPGARAYKTTVEAFIAANLGDRLTVHAVKAWIRAGASKALTLYAPDGLSAYTLTLDRPRTRKNTALWDYQDAMGRWSDFGGQQVAGTPKDWRAAGLIGPDHPALRGGQWMAVRFAHTVRVEPPSHFAPMDYSRRSKSRRKNPSDADAKVQAKIRTLLRASAKQDGSTEDFLKMINQWQRVDALLYTLGRYDEGSELKKQIIADRDRAEGTRAERRAMATRQLEREARDAANLFRYRNPARPRWKQSTSVQTLIFDNLMFDEKAAKGWAKLHGYKYGKVDAKAATFRLRQIDPAGFKPKTFRTITLTDGVQAVIGVPR